MQLRFCRSPSWVIRSLLVYVDGLDICQGWLACFDELGELDGVYGRVVDCIVVGTIC